MSLPRNPGLVLMLHNTHCPVSYPQVRQYLWKLSTYQWKVLSIYQKIPSYNQVIRLVIMVKYDSQTIVDHTDFILLPVNLQKFLLVDSRKPEDSCVIIIQRLIQHLLNITSMKMRQFQLIHIDCVGRFRLQKFHHLHNIRKPEIVS